MVEPASGGPVAEALEDPDRGFDAIVVGEYERAFCGRQFDELVPLLRAAGVQVWLPEVGGRVDLDDGEHRRLTTFLAAQSEREVIRARNRAIAAMKAQTELGRYLGGRPPYSYMLVDAGPHPQRAQARWGKRAHRLAPDPRTAPHVRWIFARRLEGAAVAAIARDLNERQVPCPSAADRERNRHRPGERWSAPTVKTILENPRYTGRQVWNRTANDRDEVDIRSGRPVQYPNLPEEWAISAQIAHPPLVGMRDFTTVQQVRARRASENSEWRRYLFTGLVLCGECGRNMNAQWLNTRPGYRCRHGYTSAHVRPEGAPRMLCWREDHLVEHINAAAKATGQRPPQAATDTAASLRSTGTSVICGRQGIELHDETTPSRPHTTTHRRSDRRAQ